MCISKLTSYHRQYRYCHTVELMSLKSKRWETFCNVLSLILSIQALRSYLRLICEYELHNLSNTKVNTAKDHGENCMKVRPYLLCHLLRNHLFTVISIIVTRNPETFTLLVLLYVNPQMDRDPGNFRSFNLPQTLPALFIGPFEHVERLRDLILAVKRITNILSTFSSCSEGTTAIQLAFK